MMGLSIVSTYSALLDNKKDVSSSKGFFALPFLVGRAAHALCLSSQNAANGRATLIRWESPYPGCPQLAAPQQRK